MTPLEGRRPRLRTVLLAAAGVVVVAVTLRVPLATVFTLGVLLICPLLMFGMHGGGHGEGHTTSDEVRTGPTDRTGRTGDGGSHVRSAQASPPRDLGKGRSVSDQRGEVQS